MRRRNEIFMPQSGKSEVVMRLGISWGCYPGVNAETQIALMQKNNFECTFLGTESPTLDEDMRVIGTTDILVENLHGPLSRETSNVNDMWRNSERSEEMLARLLDGVEKCARYEVPTLVVHVTAGATPPRPNTRGYERFVQVFDRARELGVTLACENVRPYGNLAFMLEQFEDAGFCWDVGHEAYASPGRQFMPMFGKELKAVHIHDNMLDGDHHMIPYDGKIDFDRVARQIAESPYEGSVMLELISRGHEMYEAVSAEEYYARAGRAAKRIEEKIAAYRRNRT